MKRTRFFLSLYARSCLLLGAAVGCVHASPPVPKTTQAQADQARAAANQALADHRDDVGACVSEARGVGELTGVTTTVSLSSLDQPFKCTADISLASCAFANCLRMKSRAFGLPVVKSQPPLWVFVYLRGAQATDNPLFFADREPLLSMGDVTVFKGAGILWPPRRISGEDLEYSAAAWMAGTEGQLKVKCRVDVQGVLHDCHVIKELERLTDSNLERLKGWRCEPARWNETPVEVDYVFVITFSTGQ